MLYRLKTLVYEDTDIDNSYLVIFDPLDVY